MRKADALARLKELKPELERMHIARVAVFGSTARDEATEGSDIDLLVEFSETPGLFEFVDIKWKLEDLLGIPVDIATPDALHALVRDRVLAEAVYV